MTTPTDPASRHLMALIRTAAAFDADQPAEVFTVENSAHPVAECERCAGHAKHAEGLARWTGSVGGNSSEMAAWTGDGPLPTEPTHFARVVRA